MSFRAGAPTASSEPNPVVSRCTCPPLRAFARGLPSLSLPTHHDEDFSLLMTPSMRAENEGSGFDRAATREESAISNKVFELPPGALSTAHRWLSIPVV